ncbi:HAD family phosphatase [Pseudomonas sp. sp1636]|uniref:HAD family phosphatase n=1 Tax=Pseudomonas sp. sp1636 TaxID=3036707 RepID=UPI0025A5F701|nr:HAD family phosphatase [Pseudomonas sp. sp1636]MDM8350531.1 HAD family phosphatase [Pseudomonas sp. sp1636]
MLANPPAFSALLFGLSGCLVDFGARTLPTAMQRLYPGQRAEQLNAAHSALEQRLGRPPSAGERQALDQALSEAACEHAEATPGALVQLQQLHQQNVPCAWLDELPRDASSTLATPLPHWLAAAPGRVGRPWPAPDACWQALMDLQVAQLDGCVLISGEPRLLQAGLNAGLWTIGLAACGSLCGQTPADWQTLAAAERDQLRTQATLTLYRLGVHAVIDQLTELDPCLADLGLRRQKGEKP